MPQIISALNQNFFKIFEIKRKYASTKRHFGSNHIVPDTVFLRAFTTQESYVCSMKIDKIYLRGQYGSTHIVPGKTLAKLFEAIDGNLYIILVRTIRVKPYYPLIRMF